MVNKPGLLNVTGGNIRGLIDARVDTIYTIQNEINMVAAGLITEVNALHATGYDLNGANNSALKFFTGTGAGDIAVESTLINDP